MPGGTELHRGNDQEVHKRNNAYYGDPAIDAAWIKVCRTDYDQLCAKYDFGALFDSFAKPNIALLDVGCGVGEFPAIWAASRSAPTHYEIITCDTVDISPYSLRVHRENLAPPFCRNRSFEADICEWQAPAEATYDVIWCMQSFYVIAKANVPHAIALLSSVLAPDTGKCIIYQAARTSSYMAMYDTYRHAEGLEDTLPGYLSADDITEIMPGIVGVTFTVTDYHFEHVIGLDDVATMEIYMNRMCFRPVPLTLAEWRKNKAMAKYLDAHTDKEASCWRFPQTVSLIIFQNSIAGCKDHTL